MSPLDRPVCALSYCRELSEVKVEALLAGFCVDVCFVGFESIALEFECT